MIDKNRYLQKQSKMSETIHHSKALAEVISKIAKLAIYLDRFRSYR